VAPSMVCVCKTRRRNATNPAPGEERAGGVRGCVCVKLAGAMQRMSKRSLLALTGKSVARQGYMPGPGYRWWRGGVQLFDEHKVQSSKQL
jgi:hypothetical protein